MSQESRKIYVARQGMDKTTQAGLIIDYNKQTGLSTYGIRQSHQLADKLNGKDIKVIYTSPSPAAKETGKIVAAKLKIPTATARNGFKERKMGSLAGKHMVDLPKLSSEILFGHGEVFCIQALGVESFPEVLKRSRQALRYIQSQHLGENLLIITSPQVARMTCAAFCNQDWKEGLTTNYFSSSDIIELYANAYFK